MLFIGISFLLLLPSSASPHHKWTHHISLHDNLQLSWTPFHNDIHFELVGRTHGWIALGFSMNGAMRGSDIALGWIGSDGDVRFSDRWAEGNSAPIMDMSQDYVLMSGSENDTHTVIRFSRPWDTCDSVEDIQLGVDTVRLIWALGQEDPLGDSSGVPSYHTPSFRGVRSVYLKELPYKKIHPTQENDVLSWDLVGRNLLLPNDHTHYWCQIFKAPKMNRKHHMIGFEPVLQKGNEKYLHHMVLYECHVHDGSTEKWFEAHVGKEGAACYSPNMPPEWSFCLATNSWAWAVGSEGETLPDHVGMPLGEEFGGATYFMLEIHYDNPSRDPIEDSSGIRIFYTPNLREHDTAMLLIGTEVNFLHLIPPHQEGFTSLGRCVSDCTKNGLPSEGITLINGVLHSHLASRKMKIRHLRNGKELPVILKDDHYDFNYQVARIPPKETQVLPGDELLLECQYETRNRSKPTFGGLSTREEMCIAFILYYPRAPLADCRSLPTLDTVMSALQIKSIYGTAFEKLVAFMKDIGSNGHMV
ncbi:DBH-like monooxygenase protein 1 isoform X3 [Lepeophtheirus salmonis]|uniref:DBH-like monooxygenase protein 1 isoform X3 n=1 Tax=Lepeophtheirus salmonis TaxID=72036 RepID=UPI001AE3F30F|nr:DBH-like monooxygenase protein 1 isoform X3 [Lepeophtheirus salmonis]